MYSVSRHLVTSHMGNNLRQVCSDSGIKCSSLMGVCATKRYSRGSGNGRRYYNSKFNEGTAVRSNYLIRRLGEIYGSRVKHSNSVCSRCYSQSAEKTATQEVNTNLGVELNQVERGVGSGTTQSEQDDLDEECVDMEEEGALYLTDAQIQELSQGNPELIKKIKYIQLEFSVLKEDGEKVPSFVKSKHWTELISLNSRSARKRFYLYLFKTEMSDLGIQKRKQEKREQRLKLYSENPMPKREDDMYGTFYALSRNTLFHRIYDTTVNKFYHCQVAKAMLYHPPLVLDCSYDQFMTFREAKNCAKQLELVITDNKLHREPFNLYFCNAGRNSKTMDYLQRIIPCMYEDSFPLNIHEESYLDLFPKDRLVYLTPHTRDDLEEYNEDDIYIIGGMVDKSDCRPHSLAIAKQLGLRMKRLPLDKHLMWGMGGKSLTINAVTKIMTDLRYTRGDWKHSLRHVPMRKLNRDFHPYPDQVQDQSDEASPPEAPFRKERRSMVMQDFELLNRRKGFQRSNTFSNFRPRRNPEGSQMPKMKSLLHDDD